MFWTGKAQNRSLTQTIGAVIVIAEGRIPDHANRSALRSQSSVSYYPTAPQAASIFGGRQRCQGTKDGSIGPGGESSEMNHIAQQAKKPDSRASRGSEILRVPEYEAS